MTSLRRQLVIRLLLGFALLLGLGAVGIYYSSRVALYREFDSSLKAKALAMAALTKPTHEEVEMELPRRLLPGSTNWIGYYQLFSSNGAPLIRSPALEQADLPRRLGTVAKPEFWNLVLPDGTPGRAVGFAFLAKPPPSKEKKPMVLNESSAAAHRPPPAPVDVGLVLADNRSHVDHTLHLLTAILIGAGSVTLLAAAGLVVLVLRRTLAPLQDLATRAGGIDAASLQTRFPTNHAPVEMAAISKGLNELLARLEASFERERRFSSDLAHEIRTPIAELRSLAEVKLRGAAAQDRAGFQDALDIALHMESLTAQMLTLARSEQRSLPVQREPVNVARLIENLWHPMAARAEARKLRVRFDLPDDAVIQADLGLLRGIVLNLLANAADYTPADGIIHVAFRSQSGQFALSFANTVTGLEAADLPRLFERLWRKDPARSGTAHTGLGLSLAKNFAEMMGWTLNASLAPNGELVVTLTGDFHGVPQGR